MKQMNLKKTMTAAVITAMTLTSAVGGSLTAAAAPRAAKKIIGIEQAKEAALKAVNQKEDDVVFTEQDCELDDGVYELEFISQTLEYDVEVNACTGKVIRIDSEKRGRNEHWDDDCFDEDDDCRDDDRFDYDDGWDD